MVWQRVDDQFGVSKKVTRIPLKQRLAAVGLWELASNYSARESTDGLLDAAELESVLATRPLVAELVRVGLWHGPEHGCEHCAQPTVGGIVIHDFLEYNPDASSVAAERESKSDGGRLGNHVRWHVRRGVVDPRCDLCAIAEPIAPPIANGSLRNPPVPGPVPGPDLGRTDTPDSHTSGPVGNRADGTDEGDLEALCVRQAAALDVDFVKVRTSLGKATGRLPSPTIAMRIIATVLERATPPIKSPTGVVLTAVKRDWAEWQKFIDTAEEAAA